MKKIFSAILLTILCLVLGCSGLQQSRNDIAMQIVVQRVGYYVGKNNPAIVPQAKLVAQGIAASKDSALAKAALNTAIGGLSKQFNNDPLLEADLKLIAAGFKLEAPTVKIDLSQLSPLITAFVAGMEAGIK